MRQPWFADMLDGLTPALHADGKAIQLGDGVRVPAELSLVGFDNSHLARLRALWLTSVDGAAYAMGQEAARMLLARIAHPDAPREVTLMPPRLEVRGSSGPSPA